MKILKNDNALTQIRIGVMCDDIVLTKWEVECIRNLLKLNFVELKLIILNANQLEEFSFLKKIIISKNHLFFELYQKIILNRSEALRKINCKRMFRNIRILKCKTIKKGKFSHYFSKDDIETIKSYKLDILLRFGFGIIKGEILNSAKYGVWSYHHGDERKYRGQPACFWEIFYNDPITGAVLQRLTERLDGGIIIKRGYFATINYSYKKNLEQIYLASSRWPAQVCINILNGNVNYLNNKPSKTNAPIYKRPNNGQTLLFLFKLIKNMVKTIFKDLFYHDIWNVGLVEEPIQSFLKNDFEPNIIWLPKPKKNDFHADPFGIIINDKKFVLFERYSYKNNRGDISFFIKTKKGYSGPRKSISKPFHLSYPFPIEHENNIFCIPETYEAKKVILYKAMEFPNKWVEEKILLDNISALDTTIFKYGGKWWLMCSKFDDLPIISLYLFYSDSLFGPWIEHPLNPVKTDIISSRPAGTPFLFNGKLIRPAQDGSKEYGSRIILNEILKLTPTEFEERIIKVIRMDKKQKYNKGIHTISSFGKMTLIDGKKFRFNKKLFKTKLLDYKKSTRNFIKSIAKKK